MRWLVAALLAGLFLAPMADAASLQSLKITETAQVPRVRPDYPIPAEPNQMFYLQRSTNPNTVIYAVRFDAQGIIDARDPGVVYWRRYNDAGERKPLKRIEQMFAYGVNVRPGKKPGEFTVWLKPAAQLPMLLRQTGPFKAEVLATIGGRTSRAVYVFLDVDESGLVPRLTGLSLHGIDVRTGRAVSEYFAVHGGVIQQ